MEPYSTLSATRTVPGLGIIFGIYHQTELLNTEELYSKALPSELGYPSYNSAIAMNPVTHRELKFAQHHAEA